MSKLCRSYDTNARNSVFFRPELGSRAERRLMGNQPPSALMAPPTSTEPLAQAEPSRRLEDAYEVLSENIGRFVLC